LSTVSFPRSIGGINGNGDRDATKRKRMPTIEMDIALSSYDLGYISMHVHDKIKIDQPQY